MTSRVKGNFIDCGQTSWLQPRFNSCCQSHTFWGEFFESGYGKYQQSFDHLQAKFFGVVSLHTMFNMVHIGAAVFGLERNCQMGKAMMHGLPGLGGSDLSGDGQRQGFCDPGTPFMAP